MDGKVDPIHLFITINKSQGAPKIFMMMGARDSASAEYNYLTYLIGDLFYF